MCVYHGGCIAIGLHLPREPEPRKSATLTGIPGTCSNLPRQMATRFLTWWSNWKRKGCSVRWLGPTYSSLPAQLDSYSRQGLVCRLAPAPTHVARNLPNSVAKTACIHQLMPLTGFKVQCSCCAMNMCMKIYSTAGRKTEMEKNPEKLGRSMLHTKLNHLHV